MASVDDETFDPSIQQDPILTSPYGKVEDTGTATGADVDLERVATSDSVRHRRQQHRQQPPQPVRGMSRVGAMMATAHAQDFERKKRPDALSGDAEDLDDNEIRSPDSTDYEDEDEDEDDGAFRGTEDGSGEADNNGSKPVPN